VAVTDPVAWASRLGEYAEHLLSMALRSGSRRRGRSPLRSACR